MNRELLGERVRQQLDQFGETLVHDRVRPEEMNREWRGQRVHQQRDRFGQTLMHGRANPAPDFRGGFESGMELITILQVLRRRWWLIVLCTLCAGVTGFVVSDRLPPVYEAKVLFVSSQSQNAGILDYSSLLGGQQVIGTYRELLRTRPVLEQALVNLDLPYSAEELAKHIGVNVIPDTQLLELKVEDRDPQRAADIANAIALAFLVQRSTEQQLGEIEGYESRVAAQMAALEQAIETSGNEIEQIEASTAPGAEERLAELYASRSSQQTAYANLLSTYMNLRTTKSRLLNLVVAEPAYPRSMPVRPRKTLNTAVAGLSGCIIGCAVAFLQKYLEDTLEDSEDLREALSVPSLAVIPRRRARQTPERLDPLLSEWPNAEAFRILRTNLRFATVDGAVSTLLITSAEPDEGKTSVAANLGVAMAQDGRKVLAVDADLRRPSLHRAFGLPNVAGLTSLLLDDLELERSIVETELANLYVLPSGPTAPNPSELLGSQRMTRLIEEFRAFADVVLFDVSPVLGYADTLVLAPQMDGVVLVVDSLSTRRDAATQAAEMLRNVEARVLGGVLNNARPQASGYYYYSKGGDQETRFGTWWRALRDKVPNLRETQAQQELFKSTRKQRHD
jgi:succinoglycan biosynthesis transport protein ExoP